MRKLLAFPGMHGTRVLLEDFKQKAPSSFEVQLCDLPKSLFDYQSLVDHFLPSVLDAGPCVLLGESFSGPLSVLLASQCENVEALILVASFVTPPNPWFAKFFPWRFLMSLPPSKDFVARFLLDIERHDPLVDLVHAEIGAGSTRVMARRMREVTRVDVRKELASTPSPVLYLKPDNDWLVPVRCLADVQAARDPVDVAKISAPHLVLQRKPEESWQAIRDFVSKLEPVES